MISRQDDSNRRAICHDFAAPQTLLRAAHRRLRPRKAGS